MTLIHLPPQAYVQTSSEDRRAISVPLALGRGGIQRSVTDSRPPSSDSVGRLITAICKQGVRGSSPLSSTGFPDLCSIVSD
jgi:hypothetical protein